MKKYAKLIIALISLFIIRIEIDAETAYQGVSLGDEADETTTWFHYKYIDTENNPAYCLNMDITTPASPAGTTVTELTNHGYDSADLIAISAIISKSSKISSSESKYNLDVDKNYRYYVTQIALNKYLKGKGYEAKSDFTISKLNGVETDVDNLLEFNTSAPTIKITTDTNANQTITNKTPMEYNGIKYIKSELITISLNSNLNFDIDVSSGVKILNQNGDELSRFTQTGKFYILVPVSQIDSNEATEITYAIKSSTKYTQYEPAKIYGLADSNYQKLAVPSTSTQTVTMSKDYKLTIDFDTYAQVKKVDKTTNKTISGAKLQLLDSDKKEMSCKLSDTNTGGTTSSNCSWTTTDKAKYVLNLDAGTYYLKEITSPNGYTLKSDLVKVTVTKGNVATVVLSNEKNKITFSKKDATGKNELPGATLHVLDKDKKSMSCTILKDGKEQKLDKCTWVSGTKSVEIIGLKAGKYYLKETIAPNRYVLSEELVSFEVKEDKEVTNVEMTNKLNKVVISKINAFTKKELPGATLEIQNEKGEIVKYCLEQEKNPECKWVSTEEPFVIEGLPNGTYYLVETIAPKGFVLNKEKVKFTVDGKTAISYVQMENELEVEVPDTLSSRSVLLVAISMFDIALGIGIISYVKKNKYQE